MSDPADKVEGPANPQVPEGEGQRMFAFIKQRNPAASGPASVVSADYYAAAAAAGVGTKEAMALYEKHRRHEASASESRRMADILEELYRRRGVPIG